MNQEELKKELYEILINHVEGLPTSIEDISMQDVIANVSLLTAFDVIKLDEELAGTFRCYVMDIEGL